VLSFGVGDELGFILGSIDGKLLESTDGIALARRVGFVLGFILGCLDDVRLGSTEGALFGIFDGAALGGTQILQVTGQNFCIVSILHCVIMTFLHFVFFFLFHLNFPLKSSQTPVD